MIEGGSPWIFKLTIIASVHFSVSNGVKGTLSPTFGTGLPPSMYFRPLMYSGGKTKGIALVASKIVLIISLS